jgi:hypothetical protein
MTGCAMSVPSRSSALPFGLLAGAYACVARGRRKARRNKQRLYTR